MRRAEVVKQSTSNVNGFIDVRMKYKLQFIITNLIVYILLLIAGGLYFIDAEGALQAIVRSISITLVAFLSWSLCFLMFYYGIKIRYVLKRQWVVQTALQTSPVHDSVLYYQQTEVAPSVVPYKAPEDDDEQQDEQQIEKEKQFEQTSQRDRNYVLNWMLLLTLFLGFASTLHFVLSAVFLAIATLPFEARLSFWIICELIPCYSILFFFWKKSNYEKIMTRMFRSLVLLQLCIVLFTVQYGTLVQQH